MSSSRGKRRGPAAAGGGRPAMSAVCGSPCCLRPSSGLSVSLFESGAVSAALSVFPFPGFRFPSKVSSCPLERDRRNVNLARLNAGRRHFKLPRGAQGTTLLRRVRRHPVPPSRWQCGSVGSPESRDKIFWLRRCRAEPLLAAEARGGTLHQLFISFAEAAAAALPQTVPFPYGHQWRGAAGSIEIAWPKRLRKTRGQCEQPFCSKVGPSFASKVTMHRIHQT